MDRLYEFVVTLVVFIALIGVVVTFMSLLAVFELKEVLQIETQNMQVMIEQVESCNIRKLNNE